MLRRPAPIDLYADYDRLLKAMLLLLQAPNGLSDQDLMPLIGVTRSTARRYMQKLKVYEIKWGKYSIQPDEQLIELAEAILKKAKEKR